MTQPHDPLNTPPVDNFAHDYADVVVTDTTSWTKVQGSFVADSAYKYIVIGNFFDDVETTITDCNTAQSVQAYYYIDKVCLSTDSIACDIVNGIAYPSKPAEITLFPNPVQNTLELQYLTGQNQYAILSANGTKVKSGTLSEIEHALDVSALPNGLYFLHLNGKQTFKFVVAH